MSFVSGRRASKTEPTLPLINVVFLMLIFFLVAAQVARPLDSDLSLVQTDDPDVVPPADALVVHKDGSLTWQGAPTTVDAMLKATREGQDDAAPVRILPDRDAPAKKLLDIARAVRALSPEGKIMVITQRGLE
ncbi:ExbD/TolR family protein [Pacificibacter marinus]|uniref:Biopolymer transport protein ExbD/TolR n=1 Tax=Pacificibacter marinus TaxID=658057 RepID=A0A1Y5T7G8_9RHOB|nr:biopolymer transporter ExbD [Pacificibacter marinus]SEL08168.1 biopolymer transport protein ExbD [Pacificibacter marinus]SLN57642.1 Biopolymer transport protein ExbD/TolR [Pacificibacter marinus]